VEEKPDLKSRLIITILIVAVIALLAVYCFLGMDYFRQRQGHETLATQINEATWTLAQTPQPPQDLEQRLAMAEASLVAAQGAFPRDLNSTRVINDILKLADDCQVWAIPLVTKPWSMENIGEGYHVLRLNLAIRGSFSQLTSFVSHLENGDFKSLIVENLSVSRAVEPAGEETLPVTANLDLAIYTQFTTSE
jgi:Tfp pilus assembly protein PilO